MPIKYWVAKYVDDPFRNEPRNVGVIVSAPDGIAARFVGERDDNSIDRRRIRHGFKHADVYLQWVEFWREQIEKENIDEIVAAATANYYVIQGGEVSDTGRDGAAAICNFLFALLVADTAVMDAFEEIAETDAEREITSDVSATFADWAILADGPTLHVRHPIKKKQLVRGKHAPHHPSFSQQNGKLYLFEAIDFNAKKPKLLTDRAGFMAYMFTDIRQEIGDVEAYSIVRPANDGDVGAGDAIEYAKTMLGGESTIINWADDQRKNMFLEERRKIAGAL